MALLVLLVALLGASCTSSSGGGQGSDPYKQLLQGDAAVAACGDSVGGQLSDGLVRLGHYVAYLCAVGGVGITPYAWNGNISTYVPWKLDNTDPVPDNIEFVMYIAGGNDFLGGAGLQDMVDGYQQFTAVMASRNIEAIPVLVPISNRSGVPQQLQSWNDWLLTNTANHVDCVSNHIYAYKDGLHLANTGEESRFASCVYDELSRRGIPFTRP
jgi:hypothetical protein